jgi:acetoin utilization protein AcuB
MDVRKWMTHPVHSAKPLDSIQHARAQMNRYGINQLPVIVDGKLVGIITDRDIRDVFPSVFDAPDITQPKRPAGTADPRKIPVEMAMTRNVITTTPDQSMPEAVRVMRKNRIGALPVIENDHVIGILARSDVLDAFADLAEVEDRRETGFYTAETLPRKAAR